MDDVFVTRRIRRHFKDGQVEERDDDVIRESRLLIRIDDADFIHAVCTPSQTREFVIGFLRTRGLIDRIEDVVALDIVDNTASVTRAPRLRGGLPPLCVLESTGTRNAAAEGALANARIPNAEFRVPAGVILKGMDELSRQPLYVRTGGTHCVILFSREGEALVAAEDVGRHNAVDKTIGGGMVRAVDFSDTWLAVSGRLPADMVVKPLRVGIPLIASVSAPTSGGIELGERSGLTVVGFVRGGRLNCYCHPQRVIFRAADPGPGRSSGRWPSSGPED